MLRKYTLIASVLVVFGMPVSAKAQSTMDVSMKIQAVMDQLSEVRSNLKQIQSSMNIETMLKNLGGSGDWKAMLKGAGGIFDRNAEKGGTKQTLLVLPDGLAEKADDPKKAIDWMKNQMFIRPEEVGTEAAQKKKEMMDQLRYTAYASSFGKAVATRKQLDKDLETIEKLKQDAQSKDAETDLQNEINKLVLLKLEQANYQQLLASSRAQMTQATELKTSNKLMAARK